MVKWLLAAFLLLPLAAADSRYDEGFFAYVTHDYNRSFGLLEPLAEDGGPGVKYLVGKMYLEGRGTPKDEMRALHYLKLSAEAGHEPAVSLLASCLSREDASPAELEAALAWYRKLPPARRNDKETLYRTLELERRLGHYEKAFRAYHRLSKRFSVPRPTFEMARMYEAGLGRPADRHAAIKLYRVAAKKGYAEAAYRLGMLLAGACRSEAERQEALRWLQRAGSAHPEAADAAEALRRGDGCPENGADSAQR